MAKELKQRKIKKDNKKYIKLSIVIILVIAVLTLAITIIVKSIAKPKKTSDINNSENSQTNVVKPKNIVTNTSVNIIDDKIKEITNNVTNENTTNIISTNTSNEVIENNKIEGEAIKKFANVDAVVDGIQRELSIQQVKELKGEPQSIENEKEVTTGYSVQKYIYDNGKTEIDFINLYEKDQYIVHRIKTTNTSAILTRELKVGSTVDEVIAAFKKESILYKSQDLIIVGFPGEDPIYATSIKPKLYFAINNNVVTEFSINIGNES